MLNMEAAAHRICYGEFLPLLDVNKFGKKTARCNSFAGHRQNKEGNVLPVKLTPSYQGAISQKYQLAVEPFLPSSLIGCAGQVSVHSLRFLVCET